MNPKTTFIFFRWIFNHQSVFEGATVHELGAGVGLPGILCAHYCKSIVLSDYTEAVSLVVFFMMINYFYYIVWYCSAPFHST